MTKWRRFVSRTLVSCPCNVDRDSREKQCWSRLVPELELSLGDPTFPLWSHYTWKKNAGYHALRQQSDNPFRFVLHLARRGRRQKHQDKGSEERALSRAIPSVLGAIFSGAEQIEPIRIHYYSDNWIDIRSAACESCSPPIHYWILSEIDIAVSRLTSV